MSDDAFGFLLVTASRLLRARYERALGDADLGLTPAEARTLVSAARHQPVRQTDLAAALGIEPMTLTNHLDALESRGLIRREPSATDRRSKQIVVTDEAEDTVKRIRRVLNQTIKQTLASFSEQERRQFTGFLERLCCEFNPAIIAAGKVS